MPNWKRIILVVFVLIGGTMTFAFWSQYQFNSALSGLETTITANTLLVFPSLKKDTKLASTSLEIFETLASSSEETIPVTTTTTTTASLSADTSTDLGLSFTDLELSFNFPKKGDEVYIGCTYPISWQSSTTINSLETALIDAGARKSIDQTKSGLAKENTIEKDLQNLNWKVGVVYPGKYYIKVSSINDVALEIRSGIFTISNIPKGTSIDEKEKICSEI